MVIIIQLTEVEIFMFNLLQPFSQRVRRDDPVIKASMSSNLNFPGHVPSVFLEIKTCGYFM